MSAGIARIPLAILAGIATSLASAQSAAPGNAVAEQLAESSLRMVGSMFAVLALVAICAWALRRLRDRRGVDSGSIEIVSGISLGSKERIVLVKVGEEQVLVGVSPAGMRSLHVVPYRAAAPRGEAQATGLAVPQKAPPSDFSLSMEAAQ